MKIKFFTNRTKLFKFGIIITIFFSAIIGFLNIGILFVFGIPILGLFLGLGLVLFSKEKLKLKFISICIPIPTIVLTFLIFYFSLPRAETEVFFIPQNFRGKIAVIYNQNCGQPLSRENNKRIYDVSKTNIFITSESKTLGLLDRQFYFVDENENKTNIPEFHWSRFNEEINDWHWMFSKIKLDKNLVGYFSSIETQNYQSYLISDYQTQENESKEIRESKDKEFYNLADSALKQCKSNH